MTDAKPVTGSGRAPPEKRDALDRRGKAWRLLAGGVGNELNAADSRDVEDLEGVRFNYAGESRCKVCTAADPGKDLPSGALVRSMVDDLLVRGATYSSVIDAIEPLVEDWPDSRRPSYASIRRHAQRHLRADAAAVREILERRAQETDVAIVIGSAPIVTRAGLLELITQKGFEAVATGAVVPGVRDMLAAADALESLEREAQASEHAETMDQLDTFATEVRRLVTEEVWDSIMRKVTRSDQTVPLELGDGTDGGTTIEPPRDSEEASHTVAESDDRATRVIDIEKEDQ